MNDINLKVIGKRLQKRRKELKITQSTMEEQLKITTFFISRIENGKANMSIGVLNDICCYLGMDIADVVRGSNPSSQDYLIDDFSQKFGQLNATHKDMTLDFMDLLTKHSPK